MTARGKENRGLLANREDLSKSLKSLGDRLRDATPLPCSSEILWTLGQTSPSSVLEAEVAEGEAGEFESIREKVRSIRAALVHSNGQQAEMQNMLAQALQRCESLKLEAADAQRSKEHHHHRWCVLDQERESLQRLAQKAQSSEKAALEEAVAWRGWLRRFLELWLGDDDVLKELKTSERSLQPELLAQMPKLYERIAESAPSREKVQTDEVGQLERQLAQKEIALAALEQEKRSLRAELRSLQNTVQELRGSIRVFCRIRPAHGEEGAYGVKSEGSRSLCLRKPPGERRHDFSFDRVFGQAAGQRDLFEEVGPLLPGILEGIHVCIFAYGQTGAGKTYTLAGSDGHPGLQDLAIAELRRLAGPLRLTALEIYNEQIQDLLQEDGERLEVRQAEGFSPFGSMRVPNLSSRAIREDRDLEEALEMVRSQRHVSATALNARSSRSHSVTSLSVGDGVLHIVDLAGSERTKVSQAEGLQMKEANCINRSLSALADVLFALGDGATQHVPYRNSKLTYLLQDALGGPGCKTFLFAQVSPDAGDAFESYSTLTFAARVATSVQKGRLKPRVPTSPSPSPLTAKSPVSPREVPPLPRRAI